MGLRTHRTGSQAHNIIVLKNKPGFANPGGKEFILTFYKHNTFVNEIKRLIRIERWTFLVIGTIYSESCLDRLAVVWALKTKEEYALMLVEESLGVVHEYR
ncbi:MAG TPA: hypothetical protein GX404_05160 [Syntrophomonadaceae bacterium]|nr:hypothetical protein [Syntrophomonadaceae bacterium]